MNKNAQMLVFLLPLLVIGCEIGRDSDPLNEKDIIGYYIPNHNGTETLQIRDDSIWIRSYSDTDTIYVDSGTWRLSSFGNSGYSIWIYGLFHRHKTWLLDFSQDSASVQQGELLPNTDIWATKVRRDYSRIRIMVPDYYPERYYEKLTTKQNKNTR